MRKGGILGLITLVGVICGGSRPAGGTTYIFATFKGDDAAGMKLSTYSSTDSINFTLVSDTGFGGNTTYLRDPSIMKYSDGKYYVAYTDPMKASCCNPEDHFGIAVSGDLIHWTDLATVKAGVPNVSRVWAPEWYIEGGVVRITANIDTGNADFQPYVFTAQNSSLTAWSGPTALGIGPDYIDTFVTKLGSTYHAFIKSETTRYLEHATAASLTGPWTFVGKGDWAGWGSGLEGPAIVKLDDGKYRMYVDPQAGGVPCQYMTSSDLNTWSARASIPGAAGAVIRQGTVIRDEIAPGLAGGNGGAGTGGATGTGGVYDAGVDAVRNTGGTTGTGGASGASGPTGVDGPQAAGGTIATGGTFNTGGSTRTGGTMSTGGVSSTGGTSGLGGEAASGGAASTGGASATGGVSSTGGATQTGGSIGMGGSTLSGGATGAANPARQAGGGCSLAGQGSQASSCLVLALLVLAWLWRVKRPSVVQAPGSRLRAPDSRLQASGSRLQAGVQARESRSREVQGLRHGRRSGPGGLSRDRWFSGRGGLRAASTDPAGSRFGPDEHRRRLRS